MMIPRWGRGLALLFLSFASVPLPASAQVTLIQADQVMTSTADGIVGPRFILVRDGTIVSVSTTRPTNLDENAVVLQAAFVTPGFVDARTTLGLSGLHGDDDDQDETSGPNQAHLRAIDAFDLSDPLVVHALRGGVTTVQTGPGDANSIGGQAGVFKLAGRTVGEAIVRFPSAVVFSLDETAKLTYGSSNRLPSTRMANVGIFRQAMVDADRYRTEISQDDPPARNLKKEALARVLDGEVPALVSAERADELATALRLKEEFGFDLNIVGAAQAGIVADRLAKAGDPILLGPAGDVAFRSAVGGLFSETASMLRDRSIPFAFVTGDDAEAGRTSLLELARASMAGGLTLQQALEAITIQPARILGLDAKLGSVEEGKDADLVLFDGDPSESSTRPLAVLVNGNRAYQRGE